MKITNSGNPRAPYEVKYTTESGKRCKKRFKSKVAAENFLVTLKEESAVPADLKISTDERVAFYQIKQACVKTGVTVQDALELVKSNIARVSVKGKPWEEACSLYLADAERRGCRPASIQFYRTRLNLFAKSVSPQNIAEITPEIAERYLNECASPVHSRRALSAFLGFCAAKKWIPFNPFGAAQLPKRISERELPHILTPAQVRSIFEKIPPEWTPVFALLAFCGVRPNEVIPLNAKPSLPVSAVDFKNKRITIPAEIAKTRIARIISPPKNIWKWLAPLNGGIKSSPIAPASYDVFRRIKRNCGVPILKDALRHSFASYGYHFLGAERTVEIMGHIGGFGVFAKHYKGLATPEDAKEYFSI